MTATLEVSYSNDPVVEQMLKHTKLTEAEIIPYIFKPSVAEPCSFPAIFRNEGPLLDAMRDSLREYRPRLFFYDFGDSTLDLSKKYDARAKKDEIVLIRLSDGHEIKSFSSAQLKRIKPWIVATRINLAAIWDLRAHTPQTDR